MTLSFLRLTRGSLALLLLGVAGGLFAWWMAALADRDMRASLLKASASAWTRRASAAGAGNSGAPGS